MAFDIQAAKKAGYSDQEINSYLQSQSGGQAQSQSQPKDYGILGNLFGIHLGSGQDTTSNKALGGPNALGQALLPRAAAVAQRQADGGQAANSNEAAGIVGESANRLVSPFFGPVGMAIGGALEGATNPNADVAGRLTGAATQGALEGAGGAAMAKLSNILPLLTKSGVGKAIGSKVADASAKGANDTWSNFATEVRQQVANKLGNDQPYKNIIDSRLAAETPASIDANPTVDANKFLALRQQAANREPTGIFAKFQGKSPENQVDEIIRQVASKRVKDLAGTGNLDKLFSVYSKFGSPAEIAAKGAAGGLVSALVPDQYKAQVGGGVSAALELSKILGL